MSFATAHALLGDVNEPNYLGYNITRNVLKPCKSYTIRKRNKKDKRRAAVTSPKCQKEDGSQHCNGKGTRSRRNHCDIFSMAHGGGQRNQNKNMRLL